MTQIQSILCPIDLSDNSLASVKLATSLAKQNDAKLVFIHVAPQWLPEEAMFGSEYIRETVSADKEEFLKIRPTDDYVTFDHLFVNGNPGPEIVRASSNYDLVVINTHGRSGLVRLLMGSVAEYVLRHAKCPVITYRPTSHKRTVSSKQDEGDSKHFVTELMHQVSPIHSFDKMKIVISELKKANQSGAPVIDEAGTCVGILTESDINRFCELQQRYENGDESIVDEIFETDEFGQRRAGNYNFDQVHRQMSSPPITVSNSESCKSAQEIFESNKDIHHLVVVDEKNCPIGILEAGQLSNAKGLSSEA